MSLTIVCSGPKSTRDKAREALMGLGLSTRVVGISVNANGSNGPPVETDHGEHDWGHPSYRSISEAEKAGKPNSGHTPGTGHPETGKSYAADKRISFLTVCGSDEHLESANDALERTGWVVRSLWSKQPRVLTREQVKALRGPLG